VALILASTSPIRGAMLADAGIAVEAVAPGIEEGSLKRGEPRSDALRLAEAKALAVSEARSGDWVIGSDSIVSVDGQPFDKPKDRMDAGAHLRLFSGRTMVLTSAVALARGGEVAWSTTDSASLVVRALSDSFIARYLDAEWPAVAYCVGVFRMEGRGVQLFDRIDGSHFTILGMPLLPLLGALRERGIVAA
jgi:septum formation protein